MTPMRHTPRLVAGTIVALAALVALAPTASAYEWTRPLQEGDTGPDVKALQVRMAGWYPETSQKKFPLDGSYGPATTTAVRAFQSFYGLTPDGVAGWETLNFVNGFEDPDRSTVHFDFSEFAQNSNSSCSAQGNSYAGTFNGGMVAPRVVKRNVKRLMWRLEAVRAKGGAKSIKINSGFRSVAYNDCIGGARASQHMYGTAADNRMAEVPNRYERDLARGSQLHGIGCYSSLSHNHFDIRMDNPAASSSQAWWWPRQDSQGRDLDEAGKVCWGETTGDGSRRSSESLSPEDWRAVRGALPGSGSHVPSLEELLAFEAAGEPDDMGRAD